MTRHLRCLFALWIGCSTLSTAAGAELLAVDFDGILYDLDPLSAQVRNPRDTGIAHLNGLTRSPDGDYYGHDALIDTLFRISELTGTATAIGWIGLDVTEGDLDFDPTTGILYGLQTFGDDKLFTIDVATGLGSVVGTVLTNGDASAMAFDAQGTLYVLDTRNELLLTVDPATALAGKVVSLSRSLGATAGMDFDPETGLLYVADGGPGGTNALYTLDPFAGVLSEIGNTGLPGGLSGLAFVPEPATGIFCLLIGMILPRRRRRRRSAG